MPFNLPARDTHNNPGKTLELTRMSAGGHAGEGLDARSPLLACKDGLRGLDRLELDAFEAGRHPC